MGLVNTISVDIQGHHKYTISLHLVLLKIFLTQASYLNDQHATIKTPSVNWTKQVSDEAIMGSY